MEECIFIQDFSFLFVTIVTSHHQFEVVIFVLFKLPLTPQSDQDATLHDVVKR